MKNFLPASGAALVETPLSIVLLGAGQVAGQLAPALVAAGHRVVGVWSRHAATASVLAAGLPDARVLPDLPAAGAMQPPADLVLVSVPDAVVAAVVAAAQLPAAVLVAHTAGALPLPLHPRAGVFYPVQTFSATRPVILAEVPFCLEASDAAAAALLAGLAHSISRVPPRWLTSTERATLHLAAVFAANFPNHLLGVAHRVLANAHLPFAELLGPLVREVVAKALAAPAGPFSVQTGPAARGDQPTLARHRAALRAADNLAAWLPVYEALSAAIERLMPAPLPGAATEEVSAELPPPHA